MGQPAGGESTVNLILYVRDHAAATAFYRRVLGEPSLNVPGMTEFELEQGAVLGLMPEAGIRQLLGDAIQDPALGRGIPRAEVYLRVPDPGACHARALAAGARELSPLAARDWGDEAAYSQDPDGHVLAFARKLDR
ncbi:MAG: glyoxalase [Dehalococcoidia bacterium]|nr:glyoxalase [Dehalococcoidia bacterium]